MAILQYLASALSSQKNNLVWGREGRVDTSNLRCCRKRKCGQLL